MGEGETEAVRPVRRLLEVCGGPRLGCRAGLQGRARLEEIFHKSLLIYRLALGEHFSQKGCARNLLL